ncbi:helix-turn-helix domain-containing protein [Mucilaginibacter sp. SP1R1]|uniref:helix-turn-helix domain-containing protein n=1 Tax=Mucilaginibacter sp. SP1R1 TaxID=2723091 RepID=UPI00160E7BB5|nr:helix-turn-helix transcriptional regulator [Mucilaginibacter sp. SP1R1]MBB6149586.1 transcriptional regulator with XRE-family HTH domain [Mucilaginibacter sp. SP1R1]
MAENEKTLGGMLREARELKKLSLREVEVKSGISNAYLSQLENDKIKKPSANTLYKLGDLYNITFDELMVSAGIIEQSSEQRNKNVHYAFSSDNLSQEEEQALIDYLKFLRYQQKDAK